MDKFIYNLSLINHPIPKDHLYLIGITSIWITSKYLEVYHLNLNHIYEALGKKKFEKEEIL